AREVALEERQLVLVHAALAEEPVADGAAEGVREVAEPLRAEEGVIPALRGLRLEEPLAAEPRDLQRQVLEGAAGRVEGVVQRVARDARRHAADRAGPLLDADGPGRVQPEAADLGRLD